MKKSFKEILKSGVTKVAGLALVIGMSVSIMTACGQKNTGDAGKKDPTKTPITVEDPDKEDPTPGQEDPGKEDPTPGQEEPGQEDPTPGQEDPGQEDPTPGQEDPGKEDPQPGQEEPGQEDPTPGQEEPGQEDPTPGEEKLDFSALETKLEDIFEDKLFGASVNDVVSYGLKEDGIYIVYDFTRNDQDSIAVYKISNDGLDLSDQTKIDAFANELTKNDIQAIVTMKKASSDITVDGETYSKDGIVGDNIFAEQCGVENAVMTYVGTPGSNNFDSRFNTGYSKQVQVLALYNDASNNLVAKKVVFDVENFSGYSNDQVYTNLVTEGKSILHSEDEYALGENLKASPEVEAMNAAWFNEGEELDYVQDGLNYIYDHIEDFIYKNYVKE